MLAELGHSDTFWTYEPKASTRLLNTFFDSGRVDTSLYTPAKVDFTPDVTQTALGKGFAGTMLGLPVVVLLSLLLMWRRVRRRGRFGRTASVLLRSLYTLVLGLGGWFAGVVVAQLAFPEVPLDDVLLAVLSIGVPIGLGVYLAWVRRDLPAGGKTIGFCGSICGALAGAWLGFHAGTGLLAVVTTIVGAAVGANLAVLSLDIARDREAPDRAARVARAGDAGGQPLDELTLDHLWAGRRWAKMDSVQGRGQRVGGGSTNGRARSTVGRSARGRGAQAPARRRLRRARASRSWARSSARAGSSPPSTPPRSPARRRSSRGCSAAAR